MGQGVGASKRGGSQMAPPPLLARTLERPEKDQSFN